MRNLDTTEASGSGRGGDGSIVVAGMWPRDRKAPRFPAPYVEAVNAAGGHPLVMSAFPLAPGERPPPGIKTITDIDPEDVELPEETSGVVLCGGGDVDPAKYGQAMHPRTYNVSARRDDFEIALIQQALERDLPLLAICRGMQVLNVWLGGTLDQHLADTPGRLEHDRDRPRAEPAHGFKASSLSLVARAMGSSDTEVNSHHHQGLDEVPSPLEVTGWAEDGVIEAVESRDHSWAVGVQWHPEAMAAVNQEQMQLFETFVEATKAAASQDSTESRTA